MKCTISKSVLQNMLAKVQGFTERKSTLPILSHALLEAVKGTLTYQGYRSSHIHTGGC